MNLPESRGALSTDDVEGVTYAVILVRLDAPQEPGATGSHPVTQDQVIASLAGLKFSGWVVPAQGSWVAVAASAEGSVASGRRGVVDLAATLAESLSTTVAAVRIVADSQLLLAMWTGEREIGRYVSDPSIGRDDEVLPDPMGTEFAYEFAEAAGRPDAGEELSELLAGELDGASAIESERLAGIARLLDWPSWVVAAWSMPKDLPGGPRRGDLIALRNGRSGLAGRVGALGKDVTRRLRPPADPVPEAPRIDAIDPWLL